MSESVPQRSPRLGLLGLKRIRTLRGRRKRAHEELEAAIVREVERRVYTVQEIADAAEMTRQGVYNIVHRHEG